MASPGQLVETVAQILGVPEATVSVIDRQLAVGGLRSTGGRGLNAAKVNSRDAANLLIAVIGVPIVGTQVRATTATWTTWALLPAHGQSGKLSTFDVRDLGSPTLGSLPVGHSLRDAIAALIDAAAEHDWKVHVELHGPMPLGRIRLFDTKKGSTVLDYHQPYPTGDHDDWARWNAEMAEHYGGDLSQTRLITRRTIDTIATLLREDQQ